MYSRIKGMRVQVIANLIASLASSAGHDVIKHQPRRSSTSCNGHNPRNNIRTRKRKAKRGKRY